MLRVSYRGNRVSSSSSSSGSNLYCKCQNVRQQYFSILQQHHWQKTQLIDETINNDINNNNNTIDDNYQFLQKSIIPTMYFQSSLPRLPIPSLEKTCERFLSSLKPISPTSDFHNKSKKCILNFQQTIGNNLNELLKLKDQNNKQTSYISQPWFDMYLTDRTPLPLNYNPVLVMKPDQRHEYNQQIVRSANLIISSLRFWRSFNNNQLEPEIYHLNSRKNDTIFYRRLMSLTPKSFVTYASYAFKAFPLDMSQYHRLFGVTRLPKFNKDDLMQTKNSRHIIVMRQGNIYAINVLNDRMEIELPQIIYERLNNVVQRDRKRMPAEYPVGCLTAIDRNLWANTRNYIEQNRHNQEMINKIDTALFCLCLDTSSTTSSTTSSSSSSSSSTADVDNENLVAIMRNMLAGDATNRWFDKSVSLIIDESGTTGINFEHSWGDGVAVLRYFNEIYKDTIKNPYIHPNMKQIETNNYIFNDNDKNVQTINFHIDKNLENDIHLARSTHNDCMNNLQMNALRYCKIGKEFCKKQQLSPDSIMQLAFQLAYRQLYGNYVGTYESCSTAAFKHGRTETMRPLTNEIQNLCEKLMSNQCRNDELQLMLKQCSNKHNQLTKEAAMGQGFDRHLFALKCIAIENDIDIPDLYYDEGYQKLNYHIISTSTLGSEALLAGGFGPVVRDGLGIGYSIQKNDCGVVVTSYKGGCDGRTFVDSLQSSFEKIYKIC